MNIYGKILSVLLTVFGLFAMFMVCILVGGGWLPGLIIWGGFLILAWLFHKAQW